MDDVFTLGAKSLLGVEPVSRRGGWQRISEPQGRTLLILLPWGGWALLAIQPGVLDHRDGVSPGLGERVTCLGSRACGFKSSACLREGFCLLHVQTHFACAVGAAGARPHAYNSRAWLPPGVGCPALCWVALVAPLAPCSGFGLSSALWELLQWWQPLFGEVGDTTPCWCLCRTTLLVPGAATSLLVPRGKATCALPWLCPGSVGAAVGDTVTSHRSTCT